MLFVLGLLAGYYWDSLSIVGLSCKHVSDIEPVQHPHSHPRSASSSSSFQHLSTSPDTISTGTSSNHNLSRPSFSPSHASSSSQQRFNSVSKCSSTTRTTTTPGKAHSCSEPCCPAQILWPSLLCSKSLARVKNSKRLSRVKVSSTMVHAWFFFRSLTE